jgi:DNA repair protein RecN (Recombination protein N)
MLRSLHIENMAVIKRLDFEPSDGLSVMTGETGAGKSIIIDSVNFLLCNKTVRDLVRTGESKALVSAYFTDFTPKEKEILASLGIDGDELSLERTMSADGKSVCRVDGKAVSQQVLRSVGSTLVSIHGQNDNRRLYDSDANLELIDTLCGNADALSEYCELFRKWTELGSRISSLKKSEAEKYQLRDMLEYQIKDIAAHKLKRGEEDALAAEAKRLSSLERIKKHSDAALRALYKNEKGITASYMVERAADALSKLVDVIPEYGELCEKLKSCKYELDDIAGEIFAKSEEYGFDDDPSKRLDAIESRLQAITKLKRKYGTTLDEVLDFADNAKKKLDEIDNSDGILEELSAEYQAMESELRGMALKISAARKQAAASIEGNIVETLAYLDMPKVRFAVSVTENETLDSRGCNTASFLIATNPGEPLLPLSKVASGGELSRVMLAVKCALADADGISTLIFDEIDTGVSGKTSRKIGVKLKQAATSAQVLCVTHSAQIASLAHEHFLISKSEQDGRSETSVRTLDEQGRIDETARILGGIAVTDAQRQAAVDMINEGKIY